MTLPLLLLLLLISAATASVSTAASVSTVSVSTAASAAARTKGNFFHFYGGSLIISPQGNHSDGSYQVEVRSRQATVQCHVSRFSCLNADCGPAVDTSVATTWCDSYGLAWCQEDVRTAITLSSNAAFEIRFPTGLNADDGSGYWTPNTRSSSTAWRMAAGVDLGIRSDTGESNRPPITTLPPILRIPKNCPGAFRLTVFDPDGDRVRCRVPTNSSTYECGLCGLPSGFSLDQDSCSLTYAYDGLTGFHSIELVLEDFPHHRIALSYRDGGDGGDGAKRRLSDADSRLHGSDATASTRQQASTSPLSKLPLQFTVLVDSHEAPSCLHGDYSPVFLAPTPANRADLPAFVNRALEMEVRSTAQYTTIRDLIVTGPRGISKTFIATGIYVIRWMPSDRDRQRHFPVCFVSEARDAYNRVYQSEPRCVTVHVGHHAAVVTCNQTAMKVELERTYFIRRNEDTLHLNDFRDPSCSLKGRSNATHLVAVMSLGACGTDVEEDEDAITFRNKITSSSSGQVISRHHDIDIDVCCVYPKRSNVTLGFRHKNPYAFKEKGFGSFTFQFEFFQSQRFTHQVDGSTYPVEVYLKQMIYMQIQATSSIPNTELFVETCRATPYDNPNSKISYTIIEDGCVKDPTLQIYPGSKSVFRFGLEAFEFIGAHDQVYIGCSVILCESGKLDTRCSKGCVPGGGHREKRDVSAESSSHSISQGPLHLKASDSEVSILTLNLVSNLVLAVSLFLVGGALVYRSRRSRIKYHPLPTSETE